MVTHTEADALVVEVTLDGQFDVERFGEFANRAVGQMRGGFFNCIVDPLFDPASDFPPSLPAGKYEILLTDKAVDEQADRKYAHPQLVLEMPFALHSALDEGIWVNWQSAPDRKWYLYAYFNGEGEKRRRHFILSRGDCGNLRGKSALQSEAK